MGHLTTLVNISTSKSVHYFKPNCISTYLRILGCQIKHDPIFTHWQTKFNFPGAEAFTEHSLAENCVILRVQGEEVCNSSRWESTKIPAKKQRERERETGIKEGFKKKSFNKAGGRITKNSRSQRGIHFQRNFEPVGFSFSKGQSRRRSFNKACPCRLWLHKRVQWKGPIPASNSRPRPYSLRKLPRGQSESGREKESISFLQTLPGLSLLSPAITCCCQRPSCSSFAEFNVN